MRWIIYIGQAVFIGLWAVLIANLIWPFPGKAFALFTLLLLIVTLMHLVNVLLFMGMVQGRVRPDKKDYWNVFVFGIIGWLMALRRHQQPPATNGSAAHSQDPQ